MKKIGGVLVLLFVIGMWCSTTVPTTAQKVEWAERNMGQVGGGKIHLRVSFAPFSTQAVPQKTQANISFIEVKIYQSSDLTKSVNTVKTNGVQNARFVNIPPGTYKVSLEAFETIDQVDTSITKGGPQFSEDIPVVLDGALKEHTLSVNVPLLDSVGDTVSINTTIQPGKTTPITSEVMP